MAEQGTIEDEEEGGQGEEKNHKCEECVPGLPLWMGTFSDLVTLLLTFFILLLSFAKTETAKYESALGSIRNAFGGNVFKQGEVLQLGKSLDNQPTILEAKNPIQPFPIDFLTVEGFLDKHEVNRESAEELGEMQEELKKFSLDQHTTVHELPEGIKVHVQEQLLFAEGQIEPRKLQSPVFSRLTKIMGTGKWQLFVRGHGAPGEQGIEGQDVLELSALRAQGIARELMARGISPPKITSVFYGDSRPRGTDAARDRQRRVDFILRKADLDALGRKVPPPSPSLETD